jgi:O-antigen biosynthesis protein
LLFGCLWLNILLRTNKLLLIVSVIIVNYNVKHFLGQCIASVKKTLAPITGEIIVVDNASTDGSCDYLKEYFPEVVLIENTENKGFAKACNTGAAKASGEYFLFLNPDTLVAENVIEESILLIQSKPKAGAVGVQMIDGSGKFLPESKRSFPTILSSLYKLTGLAALFPSSKKINAYALGNLNKNEVHAVDVICGAYMLIAEKVFTECKGFDEQFFMYGEDIDLSYRIKQAGYNNYYSGNLSIIHFKGESISKPNIQYTKMFYGAMKVFVEKHYAKNKAENFVKFINWLINITAVAAFIKHSLKKIALAVADLVIVFFSLLATKNLWVALIKNGVEFDTFFVPYAIPVYTLTFITAAYFTGIYDNLYKPSKALLASVSAIIVLLAFYSLLPENIRFSRGVVLVGSIAATFFITFSRWLLLKLKLGNYQNFAPLKTVVIGNELNSKSIINILKQANQDEKIIAVIPVKNYLMALKEVISQLHINEIIFSENDLDINQIIIAMKLYEGQCFFSFFSSSTNTIINSYHKNETGISFTASGSFNLAKPYYKRLKRMVDLSASLILLLSFPLQLLFIKKSSSLLKNCWLVFRGYKTWVGYHFYNNLLPEIKPCVFPCSNKTDMDENILKQLDKMYAKDYDCWTDIRFIIFNYKHLGE